MKDPLRSFRELCRVPFVGRQRYRSETIHAGRGATIVQFAVGVQKFLLSVWDYRGLFITFVLWAGMLCRAVVKGAVVKKAVVEGLLSKDAVVEKGPSLKKVRRRRGRCQRACRQRACRRKRTVVKRVLSSRGPSSKGVRRRRDCCQKGNCCRKRSVVEGNR